MLAAFCGSQGNRILGKDKRWLNCGIFKLPEVRCGVELGVFPDFHLHTGVAGTFRQGNGVELGVFPDFHLHTGVAGTFRAG